MNTATASARLRSALVKTGAVLAVSTLVTLSALGSATDARADDLVDPTVAVTAPVEPAELVEPTELAEPTEPTEALEPVAPAEAAEPAAPQLVDPAAAAGPAPVANDDLFPGNAGTTDLLPDELYLNDTEKAPTSLEIDDPAGVVAVVNGWISVPIAVGFSGNRTFQYRTTGPSGVSNWATVTIVVQPGTPQPYAYADFYATTNAAPFAVAAAGVMVNDDAQGGSVTGLNDATGQVVIHANGSFEYTPPAGFVGTKVFYYQLTASGQPSNWGKVTITVKAGVAPVAPVAAADFYSTAQGVALDVAANGVLLNDTSAAGTVFDTNDSTGEVTVSPFGALHYTPPAGFSGTKTFEYRIIDAGQLSNWATVTIVVTAPAAPGAPVAVDDKYETPMDTVLTVPASGVLANDSAGIAWWVGGFYPGTMSMNFNGSFTYQPDPGFSGTVVIDYTILDNGLESNVATITIEVVEPDVSNLEDDQPTDGGLETTDLPGILAHTGVESTWLAPAAIAIFLLGALALGYSAVRRRTAGKN